MKIFWSWQSDTPGKIGRFLIRDALQDAIDELKQPSGVEEPTDAERREALHLDHDRKGTRGSPDLALTIFKKIDFSEVVVVDITPVGSTPSTTGENGETIAGKKLINSNAAIELGYALRARTDEFVLFVFNRHYGKHEDLPFDLRHKAGALVFDLAPNADNKAIAQERKNLKALFVAALKPYLPKPAPVALKFAETSTTFNKGAYFKLNEILAEIGVPGQDQESYTYATETLCYLRFMPQERASPLKRALLESLVSGAPLLHHAFGGLSRSNDHGAITFEPGRRPLGANAQLAASTQLFPNGEIWAINADLIKRENDFHSGPLIHPLTLERLYYEKLRLIIAFAKNTMEVSTPFQVECGLVHVKGSYIKMPDPAGGWVPWGPLREQEIVYRATINDVNEDALNRFLLTFFNEVYDGAAYPRPENLFHFPPGPPHLP